MRTRWFIAVVVALGLGLAGCSQQQPKKIIAVATFVDHVVLNTIRDSMTDELKALGYTPEKGWHVIVKSANGQPDMAGAVADELLNMGPACVVSISTPSSKPVFEKNGGRLPHVYSFVSFPSSIGIRKDSPNTTGLSDGVDFESSFTLIQTLVPNLKRLGMVYSDEPNAVISKDEMLSIAKARGVEFVGQAVSKEDEIITALQSMLSKGVDAVFVGADSAVVNKIVGVVEAANTAKVPVFATDEGSIKMGALAGLSVNYTEFGRETARVVDKVIRARSADGIPDLDYSGKYLLVSTAALDRLGIRLPDDLKKRAKMVP